MRCRNCPVRTGLYCVGEKQSSICDMASARPDSHVMIRLNAEGPHAIEAALAAVRMCPHRGSVLPVSLQPECGCSELTACSAGKGKQAGKVTMNDCMACQTGQG